MPLLLLVAFLVVPLVELWVIIQVGDVIGAWWTVVLLVADSILGAVVVRREGRRAWAAFRTALAEARWPGDEVAQGALVLVGGALLLTPGFVTDVLGLSFVLPPSRALWSRVVRRRMTVMTVGGPITDAFGRGSTSDDEPVSGRPGERTIDVEVLEVRRDPPPDDDA